LVLTGEQTLVRESNRQTVPPSRLVNLNSCDCGDRPMSRLPRERRDMGRSPCHVTAEASNKGTVPPSRSAKQGDAHSAPAKQGDGSSVWFSRGTNSLTRVKQTNRPRSLATFCKSGRSIKHRNRPPVCPCLVHQGLSPRYMTA